MNCFTFKKLGRVLVLLTAVFAFSASAEDGYFSVKYLTPLKSIVNWGGVGLEYGWFAGNAVFLGVDGLFGYIEDKGDDFNVGGGFDFGYALKLPEGLRIIPGLSAGFWYYQDENSGTKNGVEYGSHAITYNFFGPFIKVQWYHVEIMYRGLLGYYDVGASAGSGKNAFRTSDDGFDYNHHQFTVGFYF
jgi:hypothetical protein